MSKSILKARSPRSAGSQHSEGSSTPSHSSTEGSDSDHSVLFDSAHDGGGRPDSTALHHVHFASDASIYLTHSTADYDRTPMKVLKNPCAMPARGCPGLTYLPMEGAGGRQRGMRDLEHGANGMEDGEEERTEEGYGKGNGQARPCQRYALKVTAEKRRRKLSEEREGPFQLPGFRTLTGFSSLVTSPHDCLGGF